MGVFYIKQELPINEQIRAKDVQVIDETGEKKGIMNINDALDLAYDKKNGFSISFAKFRYSSM